MLPEPIAVTLQVIDALEKVGAAYVIGGSLASTIHGVVRTTLDTDIIADLSLRQARRLPIFWQAHSTSTQTPSVMRSSNAAASM